MNEMEGAYKIRFKETCLLEIVTSYDEVEDEARTEDETFPEGEVHEIDVFEDRGETICIQFGDGSCIYGLPKDLIEVLEKQE